MTKGSKTGRIAYRAADDARAIVGWRFADLSVTRRQVATYGMTRQRHAWAVAFLILSGVVDQHDATVWLDDAFLIDDAAQAHAMIDDALTALTAGNDLTRLRRYLPAHLQRGKRPPGSAGTSQAKG